MALSSVLLVIAHWANLRLQRIVLQFSGPICFLQDAMQSRMSNLKGSTRSLVSKGVFWVTGSPAVGAVNPKIPQSPLTSAPLVLSTVAAFCPATSATTDAKRETTIEDLMVRIDKDSSRHTDCRKSFVPKIIGLFLILYSWFVFCPHSHLGGICFAKNHRLAFLFLQNCSTSALIGQEAGQDQIRTPRVQTLYQRAKLIY
ncbi:hypothetical protein IWX47DRAFT_877063 [Phyllosticta citricarpa]